MPQTKQKRRPWYLYVVECTDSSFYTGISTDVQRRVREHNGGQGARYTVARRPVTLRASWRYADQRGAMQAEAAFKRQARAAKKRMIDSADSFCGGRRVSDCD